MRLFAEGVKDRLKTEFKNIKFWLDELYIENNIPVTPLSHAANQTKKCLIIPREKHHQIQI